MTKTNIYDLILAFTTTVEIVGAFIIIKRRPRYWLIAMLLSLIAFISLYYLLKSLDPVPTPVDKERIPMNNANKNPDNPNTVIKNPMETKRQKESVAHQEEIKDAGRDSKENTGEGTIIYTNNISKQDIAVLIIDNNNKQVNAIAAQIAGLYRAKGNTVTTSLFTNAFLKSPYLDGLKSADTRLLDKLQVASFVKYIVIGTYESKIGEGEFTKFISRMSLDISVISCSAKSAVEGFSINSSNAFDDEQHAESGAVEKLMDKYIKTAHINL